MLTRADRDLPGLTVLALLLTGPRHTYEMHRLMIDTHKDFVTGLPRSMYHSVERLLRDGHVEVSDTIRDGARPERIVYAITAPGRAELARRVRALVATPDPDATLMVAALSFVACLPVAQAVAALRERQRALAGAAARMQQALAEVQVPRLLLLELEFARDRARGEAEWVGALVADIEAGRLTWPDDIAVFAAEMTSLVTPPG